jgi:hypothetical protein
MECWSVGVLTMMADPFSAVCKFLIERLFGFLWDKAIV